MRRALVVFATLVLLWTVLSELNHALSPWNVYVWTGGLFVTYAALTLPLHPGLLASFMGGLLCDASAPIPFGTHALLFAATHVIIFNARNRVPRDETVARIVIALLANFALALVFTLFLISRVPSLVSAWPRMISDLICSQLLIAVIAPWFFALQAAALEIARPLTSRYRRDVE
jgi:rod shape-determining protein MreD